MVKNFDSKSRDFNNFMPISLLLYFRRGTGTTNPNPIITLMMRS